MVEELKKIYENLLSKITLDFERDYNIDTDKWAIVLVWERGIGKTYLLLQILKKRAEKSFYFSADNPLLRWQTIFEFVSKLYFDYGIRFLVIDEIHKWEDWKESLKAIIDSFPDLKLIVSGSSSLDLYKWTSDLQRRIHKIDMFWLSFREYLAYEKQISLPSYTFDELIRNYQSISFDLSSKIDLQDFKAYLDHGFYPYFKGKEDIYHSLVLSNIKKVILEDLPTFMNLQTSSLAKLEKMFYFIAKNQPSELNYKSLALKIDISKDLLESIIYYLDKIGVLSIAIRSNKLNDIIRKEFKVFLWNPNIYYAFWSDERIGTIRESYVLNVLKKVSKTQVINEDIILPSYGDFIFKYNNKNYLFEVGWPSKTNKQTQWIENSFLVKDDILIGNNNEIPLWMFGLI